MIIKCNFIPWRDYNTTVPSEISITLLDSYNIQYLLNFSKKNNLIPGIEIYNDTFRKVHFNRLLLYRSNVNFENKFNEMFDTTKNNFITTKMKASIRQLLKKNKENIDPLFSYYYVSGVLIILL